MTKMMNTKSHPLEAVTLLAFESKNNLDAASLGEFLAGTDARPIALSYTLVARDVLARMESSGKLQCDIAGRYYIKRNVRRQNREAR